MLGFPKSVLDAQDIDFGVPITGYLCCAEVQPPCMTGFVFSETRASLPAIAHTVASLGPMHGLFSTSAAITKLSLNLIQHFSDGESTPKRLDLAFLSMSNDSRGNVISIGPLTPLRGGIHAQLSVHRR